MSWVWIPAPNTGWTLFSTIRCNKLFLFEIPKITKRGRGWTIKKNSHMACNNQSESFILDYRSYASVIATRPSPPPPPPCPRLGRTSRQRITCTCTYELQRHFWFRIRRSTSKIESFWDIFNRPSSRLCHRWMHRAFLFHLKILI